MWPVNMTWSVVLASQVAIVAGHCRMTGRYFEPFNQIKKNGCYMCENNHGILKRG